MDERVFVEELGAAADLLDAERVRALCQDLIAFLRDRDEAFPDREANDVLRILRKWRYFDPMRQVADALIQGGQDAPPVQRQYAQALIDQGFLTAALHVLHHLVLRTEADPVEYAEARGLLGRTYKQLFFNARPSRTRRNQQMLRRAILAYYEVYLSEPDEHLWQGINTVALLAYASRHGIPTDGLADASGLAEQIRNRVSRKGKRASAWDLATAIEACLAMNRPDEALGWAKEYVGHADADAFALGGTLRQLLEVWELDLDKEAGALLLSMIRAKLLAQENGHVELSADGLRRDLNAERVDPRQLERVFGRDAYKTYRWYLEGLSCARSVGRVEDATGRGVGTGFLVRGGDLCESLGDEQVLLTNAHVISPASDNALAISVEEAMIAFEVLGTESRYAVKGVLWSSPPEHLDVTIVRLAEVVPDVAPYELGRNLPRPDSGKRLYIIGHPLGGGLSFSLHDNLFLGYKDPRLHYRTPTDPGSSGSPIFNDQWKLVGIHHAGSAQMRRLDDPSRVYEANEGIFLQTIKNTFATQYAGNE